jgi:hypothetical protein
MKKEAAKLGANGMLLTRIAPQYDSYLGFAVSSFGISTGCSHVSPARGGAIFGAPIMHKATQGMAIYVSDQY